MAYGTRKEGADGMNTAKDNDGYDAEANAYGCWKLAIRAMRLDEIRAGRATPRTDDLEEMEVAREAGFQVVEASAHRRSA